MKSKEIYETSSGALRTVSTGRARIPNVGQRKVADEGRDEMPSLRSRDDETDYFAYINSKMKANVDKAFKVGDFVSVNAGPHKGEKHEIIHIKDDGGYNVKLAGKSGKSAKYKLGATSAKKSQVSAWKESVDEVDSGDVGVGAPRRSTNSPRGVRRVAQDFKNGQDRKDALNRALDQIQKNKSISDTVGERNLQKLTKESYDEELIFSNWADKGYDIIWFYHADKIAARSILGALEGRVKQSGWHDKKFIVKLNSEIDQEAERKLQWIESNWQVKVFPQRSNPMGENISDNKEPTDENEIHESKKFPKTSEFLQVRELEDIKRLSGVYDIYDPLNPTGIPPTRE